MNVVVPRLNAAEAAALAIVVGGTLLFGAYGVATRSPNTIPYVATVCALTTLLVLSRRTSMPPLITIALAVLGIAHLAGGLVTVGNDVLYNAHFGIRAIEYDHFVHAVGVFLAAIAVWTN